MSEWVFLRGLMRESRHWGGFPQEFKRHVPGAEVRVPDLPGNGALHLRKSPARVDRMVEHYRATLTEQSVKPPYFLLALSLGAMVAVAWAHRYPAEISACVLISTSLRPFSPFYRRLHWRNYPDLLRLALTNPDALARERLILNLTSNRPDAHQATLQTWVEYHKQYPVSRRNALRQLLAAATYRAPRDKPQVPVLLLTSNTDRLVDPDCSWQLAKQWQTDFATHPNAGHDVPLDDGEWVALQVLNWLGSSLVQRL